MPNLKDASPSHMAQEIVEADAVFASAAQRALPPALKALDLARKRSLFTVARGSSDAAANMLGYEMMRELGMPITSLPPSVFSIGRGVDMSDLGAILVSQSGASEDLVCSARGIRANGGACVAITNMPASAVEHAADVTLAIQAGPELAVPATKSVIGSLGIAMALIGTLKPEYHAQIGTSISKYATTPKQHPRSAELQAALLRNPHVYIVGRDTGFGAAHEVALKIKETCAIHAEAYSSSEVLHGPLQLVTRPLLVLILDTGFAPIKDSLDITHARFEQAGAPVIRLSPSDLGANDLLPLAASALLLRWVYPIILNVAQILGFDPDRPENLSKVTQTR